MPYEPTYFDYEGFGSLQTVEWDTPGLTININAAGMMTPVNGPSFTFSDGVVTTILSINSYGDLVATAVAGLNAGKSVNLTVGKWA